MEDSADAYCCINMNTQSLSLTYIKFFFIHLASDCYHEM